MAVVRREPDCLTRLKFETVPGLLNVRLLLAAAFAFEPELAVDEACTDPDRRRVCSDVVPVDDGTALVAMTVPIKTIVMNTAVLDGPVVMHAAVAVVVRLCPCHR